jgi:hypothetical protein
MQQTMNLWWKLSKRERAGTEPGKVWRDHLSVVSLVSMGILWALNGHAAVSDVPRMQGELTIFTAASLTDAFKEMAAHI